MNNLSRNQAEESKAKLGLMFAMYQVIGVWVTLRVAPTLTASTFNVLRLFGQQYTRADYYWVLAGTPFFPVQVGVGLILGWVLGRHLRAKSMLWVWVLPFTVLCYAIVEIPTLNPTVTSPALQAGVGQSRLAHYFGWGCQPTNHCDDQEVFTAPFYAAAAYSIGAFAAEELTENAIPATTPQFSFVLSIGIIILVAAIYDFAIAVRLGWHWMLVAIAGVPAGMGAYLILLAFSIRTASPLLSVSRSAAQPSPSSE
jgi:hypothetical protein